MISFVKDPLIDALDKDPSEQNTPRTVPHGFYSYVSPKKTKQAKFIHQNKGLFNALGVAKEGLEDSALLALLSGNELPQNSRPFAMNYGGHQFGQWAGQLGDGRAIHLGAVMIGPTQRSDEAISENKVLSSNKTANSNVAANSNKADSSNVVGSGNVAANINMAGSSNVTGIMKPSPLRWQLQLKGAGPTPYSRTADGLAVLRSSIREYLCSEAMHWLGVPTTRALSIALSGDQVLRDVLYNGNPAYEPCAVVARMAPNFIRFGSFELPAIRGQKEALKTLVTACITTHFPNIKTTGKQAYVDFFKTVCASTANLVIHWQRVGFVHGVLNTDNMSILGSTIDYGPYGWLEAYDPDWTPNTTDAAQRRYRFGNQSQVGLWNLYQLANALYPLVADAAPLEAALDQYKKDYEKGYQNMMLKKLGLLSTLSQIQEATAAQDASTTIETTEKQEVTAAQQATTVQEASALIGALEIVLSSTETDMTLFFRLLAQFDPQAFLNRKPDCTNQTIFGSLYPAFYKPETLRGAVLENWVVWLTDYALLLNKQVETAQERAAAMCTTNPKYVLRNYMAQLAIESAEKGDYSLVAELYELLQKPYEEQASREKWFAKRPEWARNKVGSSVLSCSS